MDNEVKEFLAALQKKLVSIDYIKTEDIPNIGLYMDQVTTFMDEQLEACKRYEKQSAPCPGEEKIFQGACADPVIHLLF